MAKKLKFSRWRRLQGVSRFGERKARISEPDDDLQRLTLFLPGRLLDLAESLATRTGVASVQTYCETLLMQTLEAEQARLKLAQTESRHGVLRGLDAVANDPEYLAEWSALAQPRIAVRPVAVPLSDDEPRPQPAIDSEATRMTGSAAEIVLRHAGRLGDDPPGLLAILGRGEPLPPDAAQELLQALIELERELQGAAAISRGLAFALHRLAFVSQLLVTERWPGLGADPATAQTLQMVQEAVDRVLSGEDIRYHSS